MQHVLSSSLLKFGRVVFTKGNLLMTRTRADRRARARFQRHGRHPRVHPLSSLSSPNGPRTSYEEATAAFCRECNWACLVWLPSKWITGAWRKRGRKEEKRGDRLIFDYESRNLSPALHLNFIRPIFHLNFWHLSFCERSDLGSHKIRNKIIFVKKIL